MDRHGGRRRLDAVEVESLLDRLAQGALECALAAGERLDPQSERDAFGGQRLDTEALGWLEDLRPKRRKGDHGSGCLAQRGAGHRDVVPWTTPTSMSAADQTWE